MCPQGTNVLVVEMTDRSHENIHEDSRVPSVPQAMFKKGPQGFINNSNSSPMKNCNEENDLVSKVENPESSWFSS